MCIVQTDYRNSTEDTRAIWNPIDFLDLLPSCPSVKPRIVATVKHLTGPWPQTGTFLQHTPGYFIYAFTYCWP